MPKKKDGLMPPGWDDWTQDEREDWLSYPDGKKKKKKKKKKKASYSGYAFGIKPWRGK